MVIDDVNHDPMYDVVTQIRFPDVQCYRAFQADRAYKEKIVPDHPNFSDMSRSFVSIGWFEEHVKGNSIV